VRGWKQVILQRDIQQITPKREQITFVVVRPHVVDQIQTFGTIQ